MSSELQRLPAVDKRPGQRREMCGLRNGAFVVDSVNIRLRNAGLCESGATCPQSPAAFIGTQRDGVASYTCGKRPLERAPRYSVCTQTASKVFDCVYVTSNYARIIFFILSTCQSR